MAEGAALTSLQAAIGRGQIGESDITVAQYLAMLAVGVAGSDAGFGWRLGLQHKPTSYGVNGILLLSCPSLGAALEQVLRFEALVHDLGRSSLSRDGEHAIYTWRNDCATSPVAGALAESVFAGILACAQWLAGRPMAGFALEFCHDHGEAARARIAAQSGAAVRYGARANRVLFPLALLDYAVPQANNGLLPLLQQHAEQLLQQRQSAQEPAIVREVRQAILARLGGEAVRVQTVAAALCLSARTLQRRLAEAGQSFQAVLDTTRHDLARHYLSQSTMPLAEIAYLLGYGDPAAFHHAFKSWQGQGPGQYRDQIGRQATL